ncbi:ABC transporter substrate-binding protein [Paracoccus sp. CPCC 101403]|uniref:ABC transporter substrate-binding protein n=1 Tax=Paracoccus broussonetiae TaxID=3075834 RepID=A0ABU3EJF3_9RHOB|nr:ABC transporter substrate-binding protein [Paracoccus sp. CPCC 101403]MDT1064206.1 ABC transporter substrate-binding protein [Paracoccus sp. CPCC 101403]
MAPDWWRRAKHGCRNAKEGKNPMTKPLDRRSFLRGAGMFGLALATSSFGAPHIARASATRITILSNPGLENATLNLLMEEQGFLRKYGADTTMVLAEGASGPFDAIVGGVGDICLVSGYNMVLSRISQGAPVRIAGAGMRKTALAVFARPDRVASLADLEGKTVAVGPKRGLLHALMLQLFREKDIDASRVIFVDAGSNDQAFQAVVEGKAEACCSSISHLNDSEGLAVPPDGQMWEALPKYVFQTAYASSVALEEKREALVPVMAAYGALYDYLMRPEARDSFLAARRSAQKQFDIASAKAVWDFNQKQRPYSRDLSISEEDLAYQQRMFIGLGAMERELPFDALADMWPAAKALPMLSDG